MQTHEWKIFQSMVQVYGIGVPESVLNNSGKLTTEEYEIMKRHPEIGAKILEGIPNADIILDGILHHHERFDGKGYPSGLSGDQIAFQARIRAVCDVWDALTSKRSYRDAISHAEALKIMETGRGSQFDPEVLDVFLEFVHSVTQDRATDYLSKHDLMKL